MSSDYPVGYKRPPREHQFKPDNKAAKGRRRAKKEGLSIPEILHKAIASKRKIKRGNEIVDMPVAEILVERLVQSMTTGSAKDMALIISLLERHLPDLLAGEPEKLEVSYHRAEGSKVSLPPADLWEGKKP